MTFVCELVFLGVQQGQDMNKMFKAEWEALEVVNHEFALENVEDELLRGWQIPDRYLSTSIRPSNPNAAGGVANNIHRQHPQSMHNNITSTMIDQSVLHC